MDCNSACFLGEVRYKTTIICISVKICYTLMAQFVVSWRSIAFKQDRLGDCCFSQSIGLVVPSKMFEHTWDERIVFKCMERVHTGGGIRIRWIKLI